MRDKEFTRHTEDYKYIHVYMNGNKYALFELYNPGKLGQVEEIPVVIAQLFHQLKLSSPSLKVQIVSLDERTPQTTSKYTQGFHVFS